MKIDLKLKVLRLLHVSEAMDGETDYHGLTLIVTILACLSAFFFSIKCKLLIDRLIIN